MTLNHEDARSKSGQAMAPGRRALLSSAATGLVIGAGVVAGGSALAPKPAAADPIGNEAGTGVTDWLNVTGAPYAADPTGGADSTAGIRKALSDSFNMPQPVPVYLPSGNYQTTGPLIVKSGVTLIGSGDATIIPSPMWAAGGSPAGVVVLSGGGYQKVINVGINGAALPVAASGILSDTNPESVLLQDVDIQGATNHGVDDSGGGGAWYVLRVTAADCAQDGFNIGIPDCTYTDCTAISNKNHGWNTVNGINCRFTGCRSEWNTNHGYCITGDLSATGGLQLTGCSTDRNGVNGVYIHATGTWPILLTGMMLRRDGRNGTGNGYAALCVNGTSNPVIIDAMTVFPGFNDNGSGTESPGYGVQIEGTVTYVSLTNAYLHALIAGISGTVSNGRAVATRIGTWWSEVAITRVADTS